MQYLMTRKRLMLSKMARGYDDFAAVVMLLFEIKKVTTFSVRGCSVTPGTSVTFRSDAFGVGSGLDVKVRKFTFFFFFFLP